MDARLDTLSKELYQVNVRVDRIARRQAILGGFAPKPTPSPPRPVASDSDDDDDGDDAYDDDGDVYFTLYPLSLVTKRGIVLDMRVVTRGEELVFGSLC